MFSENCYHRVTNKFPYHSLCWDVYRYLRFTRWRQYETKATFKFEQLIFSENCYHRVTNKFPYHSFCWDVYRYLRFTWWRQYETKATFKLARFIFSENCYYQWPISSRITVYVEMYTVTWCSPGEDNIYHMRLSNLRALYISENCYHRVTNKFRYHSSCWDVYRYLKFTWWR